MLSRPGPRSQPPPAADPADDGDDGPHGRHSHLRPADGQPGSWRQQWELVFRPRRRPPSRQQLREEVEVLRGRQDDTEQAVLVLADAVAALRAGGRS